jgi:GT2 family glycosyltransferase/serine acetyltransferase
VSAPEVRLAIIILNYRTPEMVIACLDSLRGQVGPGMVTVVVDNASGDGSADRIEAHVARSGYGGWARVQRSPINGGFAAGNNLGIRSVSAESYILLNSDTIARPGAIAGLLQGLAENPSAGIIGPGLEDREGALEQSCFRFPHPVSELIRAAGTGLVTRMLRRYDVPMELSEVPVEVDWLAFACVAIRRVVIEQVGLLDEGFFMYYEDIDYCHKVRAAGWKILYWPKPRIVHLMGGSSNITSSDPSRRRPPRYLYEARARYFAKYHGGAGLLAANALWIAGRAISRTRELVEGRQPLARDHEARDIWTNVLHPSAAAEPPRAAGGELRAQTSADERAAGGVRAEALSAGEPAGAPTHRQRPLGDRNANPEGIGLVELLREDFATHDRNLLEPGFWAVAVHRFGNWRMGIRPKVVRAPLTVAYRTLFTGVNWLWGIDIGYNVKLGRRVRLWHHGTMVLSARAIGDDVHIRHNTTFGVARRDQSWKLPIIEDRVDVGVGACVLGDVTVGHDSLIGANAVVVRSCPPHSTVVGIPGRPLVRSERSAGRPARAPVALRTHDPRDDQPSAEGEDEDGEDVVVVVADAERKS